MKKHKMIMRLCAYAMLGDGTIGEQEKSIILDAIVTEGLIENGKTETAEDIFENIYSILKSYNAPENEALSKSLFTSLGRSLESEKNLKKELVYYVRIARADQKLLDVEREGFRLICKLHKLEDSTILWNELHREAENLEKEKKHLNHLKLKNLRERKTNLAIEDFQAIQQIISFYQIEGALKKSASYVLEKERTKKSEKLNLRNKLITKYSFILFCSLASILFLRIPACELATDCLAPDLALHQNETLYGVVTDSVQSIMVDKISSGLRDQKDAEALDSLIQENIALYAGNMISLRDVIAGKIYDDISVKWSHTQVAQFRCYWSFLGLGVSFIATFVIYSIFCGKRKKEHLNPKCFNKNLRFLLRWIVGLTIGAAIFCYDVGILFMMISIEWLIFMRESKKKEKNKPNMLVIMVAVAIITDISYGLVNTTLLHQGEIELLTIAAPVFLGCVCFLFGKWLEDNRENDKLESEKMNEIVTYLSGNTTQQ